MMVMRCGWLRINQSHRYLVMVYRENSELQSQIVELEENSNVS